MEQLLATLWSDLKKNTLKITLYDQCCRTISSRSPVDLQMLDSDSSLCNQRLCVKFTKWLMSLSDKRDSRTIWQMVATCYTSPLRCFWVLSMIFCLRLVGYDIMYCILLQWTPNAVACSTQTMRAMHVPTEIRSGWLRLLFPDCRWFSEMLNFRKFTTVG